MAVTNGIVDGHLNEDPHITASERPLSGIMSTTSSRPSTSATIVHVHSQPPVKIMPAVHRDPSIKRIQNQNHNNQNHSSSQQLSHQNSNLQNSVVFHENPTSYHTIIKVLTRLTPHFSDCNHIKVIIKKLLSSNAYHSMTYLYLMTNSHNLKKS